MFFTTKAGAVAHAARSARFASPSGIYVAVQHVADTYQPTEGGKAYRVELAAPGDDYVVHEVSAVELARLVQSGLRAAITLCEEKAKAHDLAAGIMKPGSAVCRLHTRNAAEERDRARELETLLTVSAAKPVQIIPKLCACGKPATCSGGQCTGCSSDAFEVRNRALPAAEQRD